MFEINVRFYCSDLIITFYICKVTTDGYICSIELLQGWMFCYSTML
uniref:Uncharacterized protein n=1 Tax=Meloidogyne enterolobii TaxID=390850 RepID=A0A6V7UH01_MELEN|nr:unnamed protein product [Meloidogyne enterolobii]